MIHGRLLIGGGVHRVPKLGKGIGIGEYIRPALQGVEAKQTCHRRRCGKGLPSQEAERCMCF